MAHSSSELPDLWWGLLILPLLVSVRILAGHTQLTSWLYRCCWLVAGIVWLSFRANLVLTNELPVAYEMHPSVVAGVIDSLPKQTDRYTQFHFQIHHAQTEQGEPYTF